MSRHSPESTEKMQGDVKPTPVVLSASGHHGVPGTQGWDGSNTSQAPQGAPGRHGRDAAHPTPGESGGNLHVSLSYNPNQPGLVHAAGQAHLAGQRWDIAGQESLLLDCRGGNGGSGGLGEDGQAGGNGFHGMNATQFSEATVRPECSRQERFVRC